MHGSERGSGETRSSDLNRHEDWCASSLLYPPVSCEATDFRVAEIVIRYAVPNRHPERSEAEPKDLVNDTFFA